MIHKETTSSHRNCRCAENMTSLMRMNRDRDMQRAIVIIAASMIMAGLGIGIVIGYVIRAATF